MTRAPGGSDHRGAHAYGRLMALPLLDQLADRTRANRSRYVDDFLMLYCHRGGYESHPRVPLPMRGEIPHAAIR